MQQTAFVHLMQQRSFTRAVMTTKLASVKHKVKLAYNLFTPYSTLDTLCYRFVLG